MDTPSRYKEQKLARVRIAKQLLKQFPKYNNRSVANMIFTNQGLAIQIAVPEGKSVSARFYEGNVLHKLKKYFLRRRPATSLRGVRLLHDNASSHKAAIVRKYLKQ